MPYFFTRSSQDKYLKKIEIQNKLVKKAGNDMGEEAGINCDWHDNFGYEEARRRLELESKRLKEMMDILNDASIVEIEEQDEIVKIGCTVVFYWNDDEKELTIGGYGETEPKLGLVSYMSPIGSVLFNHRVDDFISAKINGKDVEIEIIKIFPPSYKYKTITQALNHGH